MDKKDGTFVKEAFIQKTTLGSGSVWDIAFSKDPQQQFIYLADGSDEKVFVLLRDQRFLSRGPGPVPAASR